MTIKEELIREIEQTPMSLASEILEFVRYLKAKQPKVNFMDFAGMATDIDPIMESIVKEAEENRLEHRPPIDL